MAASSTPTSFVHWSMDFTGAASDFAFGTRTSTLVPFSPSSSLDGGHLTDGAEVEHKADARLQPAEGREPR